MAVAGRMLGERLLLRRGTLTVLSWFLAIVIVAILPWLHVSGSILTGVELTAFLVLNASSICLSFGVTGELNLSQVAVYAGGAYLTGYISEHVTTDIIVALVASGALGLFMGLIVGLPAMRVRGWTLAVTSFFLVLLVPDILQIFGTSLGGTEGLAIPIPTALGVPLTSSGLFVFILAVTGCWLLLMRNLINSRHGEALMVLKQSPILAQSIGVPVGQLRIKSYALSSLPAALAGCLYAYFSAYVDPTSFSLNLTIDILAVAVLGGLTSVYGVIVGGLVMEFAVLQPSNLAGGQGQLVFGGLLIFCGLAFMGGIAGVVRRLVQRFAWLEALGRLWGGGPHRGGVLSEPAGGKVPSFAGGALVLDGVGKGFGGNQAVENVSLRAEPGSVTALIGPNGSGKTTVLNLISGFYKPDRGSITLGDVVLSGMTPHRVACAGIGRTFQTPRIPEGLSVLQVAETGRDVRGWPTFLESMLRLPRYWSTLRRDREVALVALSMVGLAGLSNVEALSLPLASRRQCELARALASSPRVLLVDEVAAGLDVGEVEALGNLLRQLAAAGLTIILIEHNFELVRSVANISYALANGRVIAVGTPTDVEADPVVQAQYFGSIDDVSAGGYGVPAVPPFGGKADL